MLLGGILISFQHLKSSVEKGLNHICAFQGGLFVDVRTLSIHTTSHGISLKVILNREAPNELEWLLKSLGSSVEESLIMTQRILAHSLPVTLSGTCQAVCLCTCRYLKCFSSNTHRAK